MKQLAVFILAITTLGSYGQDNSSETSSSEFKRVQIGVSVSPDICFRTLKNNDGSRSSDDIVKFNNENETVKFGYTASIRVCFNLTKFLGLETGVQYSNKGYQTKFRDISFGPPDPAAGDKVKYIYDFHYFDIPIKANFIFGKNKVRFLASVGMTTNIFMGETTTNVLVYSDGSERKRSSTNDNYEKVDISPTLSVGFDYKINERMNLRVEPTFRYGILKITNSPITGYLYSGGLSIGYYFGL